MKNKKYCSKSSLDEFIENEERCIKHFEKSVVLYETGKKLEAIKELHRARRYKPDDHYVLHNLACYYDEIGQKEQAYLYSQLCFQVLVDIIEAEKIADKNLVVPRIIVRDYAIMLAGVGHIFLENNDEDKAKRCYEIALKIDPENAPARYNMAGYYLKKNLIEDAMDEYQKAYMYIWNDHEMKQELLPEIVTNLSYCYSNMGMLQEGVNLIEEYIKEYPAIPEMLRNLSSLYLDLNRLDDAVESFRRWSCLEPGSAMPHAGLAVVYALRGWRNEAYGEIDIARRLNEKSNDHEVEELIKGALEILEDQDGCFNLMLFLLILAMVKGRMKRQQLVKR